MTDLKIIGQAAKDAAATLRLLDTKTKNQLLQAAADALYSSNDIILIENEKDLDNAIRNGMSEALQDRLRLTHARIAAMAKGLNQVATLNDPVGEIIEMKKMPNGLTVGQQRVPLGVIGVIYEARPNVTADVFGLCFKSGNAAILRGGKEAINTNTAIVKLLQGVLKDAGYGNALQLITDTSRETAHEFMRMREYVDVLIPRGGAGLIQSVIESSNIPVIETGTGNCHIFVDESADPAKAIDIIINAKVQRPSVCNACEKVLIHRNIAEDFLPRLYTALMENNVEVRGDGFAHEICADIIPTTEDDWSREYLDYIIGIAIVNDLDAAIKHISKYSSGHSEAILTNDYTHAGRFVSAIDSAAVYVNASTRFTDGEQFGLGAEIGISTQKLHARGPMGLKELTSSKYVIYGEGQIRE